MQHLHNTFAKIVFSTQRFMSRFSITIHIFFKSESKNYKILILINDDYVLNWLYHVKNDENSVNLNTIYIKKWNYFKTQVVVFDLLQQKNISNDFSYVVWIDNLFTSIDVIVTCKRIDFEVADTVRTFKTKRKKLEIRTNIEVQKKRSESNRNLNSTLFDLKLKHEIQIEWNIMYEKIINDVNVLQFAWKNQQMIFFMTSIDTKRQYVEKKRRKFAKTTINAKISKVVFDNESIKTLSISKSIDLYNYYMNEMNVTNQLRNYYDIQEFCSKTWKSFWHFLLDTTITNSYKIINITEKRSYAKLKQNSAHKVFRNDFITDLFEHSERITESRDSRPDINISLVEIVYKALVWEHETIQKLDNKDKYCMMCSQTQCKQIRTRRVTKSLQKLSRNSLIRNQRRRRDSRTVYGCRLCDISLCNNERCFNEHLRVIE